MNDSDMFEFGGLSASTHGIERERKVCFISDDDEEVIDWGLLPPNDDDLLFSRDDSSLTSDRSIITSNALVNVSNDSPSVISSDIGGDIKPLSHMHYFIHLGLRNCCSSKYSSSLPISTALSDSIELYFKKKNVTLRSCHVVSNESVTQKGEHYTAALVIQGGSLTNNMRHELEKFIKVEWCNISVSDLVVL